MDQLIRDHLAQFAAEQSDPDLPMIILYACEGGSRMWGTEVESSDYDVRFICARPRDWYLTIEEKLPEQFDRMVDNLDISGWDILKVLRMLGKSNPTLLEWLRSPVVYTMNARIQELLKLAQFCVCPKTLYLNYMCGLAEGNYDKYIKGDDQPVRKKYLHVMRGLLSARYVAKHHLLPPVNFEHLCAEGFNDDDLADREARSAIRRVLQNKQRGADLNWPKPAVPRLNEFIVREIETTGEDNVTGTVPERETPQEAVTEMLNSFLRDMLNAG
jgi:hypothetical protein